MSFPPIADYAFLSDCEVNTLIAPDGSVEWLCLPRPDAPSVFGSPPRPLGGLLPLRPDQHRRAPPAPLPPGHPGLETTWHTPTGWMTVPDVLVIGPVAEERREGYRRSPGDAIAQRMLLRIATCFDGQVELEVNCLPLFDYGRSQGTWEYDGAGYDRATVTSGDLDPDPRRQRPARARRSPVLRPHDPPRGESAFVTLGWGGERADRRSTRRSATCSAPRGSGATG